MKSSSFRMTAAALAAALNLFAQVQSGTISGVVTDQQDAIISGAQVEIKNTGTNAVFRTQTNDSGNYTAPGLPIGDYEITAQLQGFKRTVRSGIRLQVNQNAQVNVRLEVGQLAESVEVTGEAPLVDTGSATLGAVIENRRVRDLPLNGRSALALTLLNAGVISNAGPTNSGFGDRGIQLSSLSINGSPNSMNNQTLDGNNNVLSYVGEVGIPPAVDAVEEFKVQSGAMSAEFGFTAGGTINLVTKSGTNQIHGTAYEFLRNDKFDARNTFAANKLPLRYNQFGVSAGGPIIKDKTFVFGNWEEYRLRQSRPRITSTPIAEWRQGNFANLRNAAGVLIPIYDPNTIRANPNGAGQVRDLYPGNIVPTSRFDPISRKIVDFYPAPNRVPSNAFTFAQNFQDSALTLTDWTQWNLRADHRFNERHSIFFRYTSAQHSPSGNSIFTDPTVGQDRVDDQVNRNAVISDTYTLSPTLINNLRVGIMRQFFTFRAINGGQGWPRKLGLPEIVPNDQFPQINFGFDTIGGQAFGTRASLNWDIQEMLTKVTGNHTTKFGFNYRILYGGNRQGAALSGDYAFGGLTSNPQSPAGTGNNMAQFLTGDVSSSYIDRILGNSNHGTAISWFVQDDWKVSRRLSLNLGIRWDWQQSPYERYNGLIDFDPSARVTGSPFVGNTVFAGRNGQPRSFRKEDYNDFAPRFGFALDVFGSGKTVIRGGYGIYYPSIFFRPFLGNPQLFSSTRTNYVAQGPGQRAFRFQDGFPTKPLESPGAAAGPLALLGQGVSFTQRDETTPLTQQWNFGIQHQIANWLIDVTYAGNKGNGFMAGGYNLNQVDPAVRFQLQQNLNTPVPNPYAGLVPGGLGAATITRERSLMPFPYYTGVTVSNPLLGNYLSHQLQLNIQRRMRNGLLLNFAYTNGKKFSDSTLVPVDFGPIEQITDNGFQDGLYNRKLNRSIDPGDVSQRLVVSALYELPFGRGKAFNPSNGVAQRIVGGWQINMISVMQTGIPLTVRGANNNAADRPNSTGVSAELPSDQRTAQRWFDTTQFVNPPQFTLGNVSRTIGDVRHPGTVNFDLSLVKDTRITERFNLQFRAEAFNALNHVNYGLVDDTFGAGPDGKNARAQFGTITTARDARIMQLGLKLIF
ncbi:MAG: carboxypeptidase regulatory-like domain-containing protein [Bryobacterales bacterium]|nr:carboxypeptidase regulatory-like domain-containing protein [Bryobacterales bacterium]